MNPAIQEKECHFTVTGEFLTQISRQLWADERQPEKAINLLKEGLRGITMEQVLAILTGAKKLVGNSDDESGIGFVDDDTTISENGFPLGLKDLISRFRMKEDQLEDEVQFFSKQTELVPSPKGLVEVPRRRTTYYTGRGRTGIGLKEGVDLEKIPHQECSPHIRAEHMFRPENRVKRIARGLDPGLSLSDDPWTEPDSHYDMLADQDLAPEPPPSGDNEITTDCGWLSPEGKFYRCIYMGHISLAHQLGFDEVRLEKLGWLKVQEGKIFSSLLDNQCEFNATQTQRDLVFDYCHKNGKAMPLWMAPEA